MNQSPCSSFLEDLPGIVRLGWPGASLGLLNCFDSQGRLRLLHVFRVMILPEIEEEGASSQE